MNKQTDGQMVQPGFTLLCPTNTMKALKGTP